MKAGDFVETGPETFRITGFSGPFNEGLARIDRIRDGAVVQATTVPVALLAEIDARGRRIAELEGENAGLRAYPVGEAEAHQAQLDAHREIEAKRRRIAELEGAQRRAEDALADGRGAERGRVLSVIRSQLDTLPQGDPRRAVFADVVSEILFPTEAAND